MNNPTLELLLQRPRAAGKVFFVESGGSDSNEGTDPNYPLLTVQAAIDKCTDFYNDYVFVSRRATTDLTTTTAILMNKHTVHLIALGNINGMGTLVRLVYTNETDNVMEFPQDVGYHCEVAGFGFAGGTTAKGGIAVTGGGGGGTGSWIHHCNFGGLLTKGTPDYGVFNDGLGAEMQSWLIEDCIFSGGGNASGLISVNGVNVVGSPGILTHSKGLTIRRNLFVNIPGIAINLDGICGGIIVDNSIALGAETKGKGITLGNDCRGCWVDGNHASFGDVTDATSLFNDLAGADANSWGVNYQGKTAQDPVQG